MIAAVGGTDGQWVPIDDRAEHPERDDRHPNHAQSCCPCCHWRIFVSPLSPSLPHLSLSTSLHLSPTLGSNLSSPLDQCRASPGGRWGSSTPPTRSTSISLRRWMPLSKGTLKISLSAFFLRTTLTPSSPLPFHLYEQQRKHCFQRNPGPHYGQLQALRFLSYIFFSFLFLFRSSSPLFPRHAGSDPGVRQPPHS